MSQLTLYDDLIRLEAADLALDFDLLRAQVLRESSGDTFAFRYEPRYFTHYILDSPVTPENDHPQAKAQKYGPLAACSFGLMQILLETAVEIGFARDPWDLFIPGVGLHYGALYLRRLVDLYHGDVRKALAAYNGGPGAVSFGPPYRTQAYVDGVYALALKGTDV